MCAGLIWGEMDGEGEVKNRANVRKHVPMLWSFKTDWIIVGDLFRSFVCRDSLTAVNRGVCVSVAFRHVIGLTWSRHTGTCMYCIYVCVCEAISHLAVSKVPSREDKEQIRLLRCPQFSQSLSVSLTFFSSLPFSAELFLLFSLSFGLSSAVTYPSYRTLGNN